MNKQVKPFLCDICHLQYNTRSSLKYHIDDVHEGKKPFSCAICTSAFPRKGILKRHIEMAHEGERETI